MAEFEAAYKGERSMENLAFNTSYESVAAFGSIENAQEYLTLLAQVIEDARQAVESDTCSEATASEDARRLRALRIIVYNLDKLGHHIKTSRRILNDLRTLRRLLFQYDDAGIPTT